MTKRGILLVLVLVSLALTGAILTPLALLTGNYAVKEARSDEGLIHHLAGDSLVAVLPEWLEKSPDLRKQLERDNRALLHLQIGPVEVDAVLQDDTAKLPVAILMDRRNPERLRLALERIARFAAPNLRIASVIQSTGSLDELFEAAGDTVLFGDLQTVGISEWVSPMGNRIYLERARDVAVEAVLQDVKPGLGLELARLRRLHANESPAELVSRLELPEADRRAVTARLAEKTERYSLRMRTRSRSDVRWRYLICSTSEPAQILLDWEIAP